MALSDALRSLRIPAPSGDMTLSGILEPWHEALASCLPVPLRRALAPRDRHLILALQGKDAILYRESGEGREALGKVDGHTSNAALGALLSETKKDKRKGILIELPDGLVISRTVSLPAQVRKNLAQVVAYEIDRLTPFHADQVCFDFHPSDIQPKNEKIAVQIALCRRDLVHSWVDRLRSAGAPADRIIWENAWPKANLLSPAERPKRSGRTLGISSILLILILLLTAAVLIGPIWQKTRILEGLERNLDQFKTEAEAVHELRSAIEQARQGSTAVLERKSDQPRMIDLLRELTNQLPDGTWVQNLDFRNGEVQIRGESSQAATLIGILEKIPGFEEVAFRSPVVQVAATGQERFHIAFRYTRSEDEETP